MDKEVVVHLVFVLFWTIFIIINSSSFDLWLLPHLGFSGGSVVKNLPANARDKGDMGSVPGWGRSPGGGNGNPFRDSCLENPTDGGAWRSTVYGVMRVGHDWVSMHACITGRMWLYLSSEPLACFPNPWHWKNPRVLYNWGGDEMVLDEGKTWILLGN